MYGKGLIMGMLLTIKKFFSKKITENYPDEQPLIDDRWRGSFKYDANECILCNMCVNACPNKAIILDFEKDENNKRILKRFEINFERCLVCGFCVEACPKKCLRFTKEFELSEFHKENIYLDLFKNGKLELPGSVYFQEKIETKKEDD